MVSLGLLVYRIKNFHSLNNDTMQLSDQDLAGLLKSPNLCPNCKGVDVEASMPRIQDDDTITCDVICDTCGQQWVEVYTMTAVKNIEP